MTRTSTGTPRSGSAVVVPAATTTGGGSLWIYFGSSGCIGCVYFGQVGDPIPVPDSREEP